MKRKIVCALALLFCLLPILAETSPMSDWTFSESSVTLNGKKFRKEDYPKSFYEQDGYAIVEGHKLHYWLYDTYTYHNGDGSVILNRIVPYWVEQMGYSIDYDNIETYSPNTNLADSVKTLMRTRGADISLSLLTSQNYNTKVDYVVINSYDKDKNTYKTFVYYLYKAGSRTIADKNQMIYIKGGKFQMGGFNSGETPVHTVEVSSFYMSKYKCTMSEWLALFDGWLPDSNYYSYVGYDIRDIYNKKYGDYSDFNLLGCTWYNAIIYCNRRSVMEGLTPCYASNGSKDAVTYSKILKGTIFYDEVGESLPNITCDWEADGYRLPTEAEWEYVACGGSNYTKDNLKHSSTTNNTFGIYDMLHSNAAEWCWDYYSETYYQESINAKDPKGPKTGKYRCIRGGSVKGAFIKTRISDEPTQKGCCVANTFRVVRKAK